MSVRVTVPRRVGLTPGPAIGAPAVSNAGQSTVSHGAPVGFGLSLQPNGADVRAWSSSALSTYREQPAVSPDPTTSTRPYGVEAADTVAGPDGGPVTGEAQGAWEVSATAGGLATSGT